jgi:glyoxylase-like metal-dependent hydrolase (beta-lactamase superfamily II)
MLMFNPVRMWIALTMMSWAAAVVAQATIRPTPVLVAPNSYMVQGLSALGSSANRNFISNAAFVVTKDGVLVIDALGSPALARELLAEIRRITPAPVRYVVLTHYHADHIYGLQVFKEAGATVIAHQAGREYLNSDTAALRLQASQRRWPLPWTRRRGSFRPIDGSTPAPHCRWAIWTSCCNLPGRHTRPKIWWSGCRS